MSRTTAHIRETPTLANDCEVITRQAADALAGVFGAMVRRGVDRELAQRFILQRVIALFVQEIETMPRELFSARVELREEELDRLKVAAAIDWSKVSPVIFRAVFQDSLEAGERHALGAHFTSPADISKIVGPTIVRPWTEAIEAARDGERLNELLERLSRLRVLDPACGSGNFLYVAYREMKRLEARIRRRLASEFPESQPHPNQVSPHQFFGIDLHPFALELAKVCLLAGDGALEMLDANFHAGDALLIPWQAADVIIGNPPFLGAKRMKPERGSAYVNALRRRYPEIPGMADYCVYWFRRAHDHLPGCTRADPLIGRAGLVGTQNIRSNQSRVGGLDYITAGGTIVDAVDNQPWSGDANVHVSIVNWVKTRDAALLPIERRLCVMSVEKIVDVIPPSLSIGPDYSARAVLECNRNPRRTFQGKVLGYEGFLLNADERERMLEDSGDVIFPIVTGRELLDEFRIKRWVIDFGAMTLEEARKRKSAFAHCERRVLPEVEAKLREAQANQSDMADARAEHLQRWWQFWNRRDELNVFLEGHGRYIACSRVTRRPIFVSISTKLCPSDALQVFGFDDDYSFGILQSVVHYEWFKTSSRLKVEVDLRYSSRAIFDTFPWPQDPAAGDVEAVANAARRMGAIRRVCLAEAKGGLRDLYRELETPGTHPLREAHEGLDRAVLSAYGMRGEGIVQQLLELNVEVARRERDGEAVRGPGGLGGAGDFAIEEEMSADNVRPGA